MDNKNLLQKIEIERQSLTTKIEESERFLVEARGKLQFIDSLLIEEIPRPKPILIERRRKRTGITSETEDLILAVRTVLEENKNIAMTISQITEKIDKANLWSRVPKNFTAGKQAVRFAIKKTEMIRKTSQIVKNPKPSSTYMIDTTKA